MHWHSEGANNTWMVQHRRWQQVEMTDAHINFKVLGKTFPVPEDLLQNAASPQFKIEPQWESIPLVWKLRVIGQPSSINLSLFMGVTNTTDVVEPEFQASHDSFLQSHRCCAATAKPRTHIQQSVHCQVHRRSIIEQLVANGPAPRTSDGSRGTERSRSPARSTSPRQEAARSSDSHHDGIDGGIDDDDEGQEQGEEDEPDDDPIVSFDDDNRAASLPQASSNTLNTSTLPAPPPPATGVTSPGASDADLEKEMENLLTPETAVAAGYQLPELPATAEAGRVAEVEDVSFAKHNIILNMVRSKRSVVSNSSATSSQMLTPRRMTLE